MTKELSEVEVRLKLLLTDNHACIMGFGVLLTGPLLKLGELLLRNEVFCLNVTNYLKKHDHGLTECVFLLERIKVICVGDQKHHKVVDRTDHADRVHTVGGQHDRKDLRDVSLRVKYILGAPVIFLRKTTEHVFRLLDPAKFELNRVQTVNEPCF